MQDKAAGYSERAKQAAQEGVDSVKTAEPTREVGETADKAVGTTGDFADAAKETTVGSAAAAGAPFHSSTTKPVLSQ